jgi:hypothetical protein
VIRLIAKRRMGRVRRLGVLSLALALAGCLDDGDGSEARRRADGGDQVRELRVGPEEARRVVSVKLTRRAPRPVAATCPAASREESLRLQVVCPGLVPDVRIVTEKDNPNRSVPFPPNWYELTFNTAGREPRHWVVGAGRPAAARENVLSDKFHEVKGLPMLVNASASAASGLPCTGISRPAGRCTKAT